MSYKYVSPKFLNDGCVLSLIASKANKGSSPVIGTTVVWSDQSNVRNKYTYKNVIERSNFPDLTNWSLTGATGAVAGGVATLTGANNSANPNILGNNIIASYPGGVPVGLKFYVTAKIKAPTGCTSVSLNWRDTTAGLTYSAETNSTFTVGVTTKLKGIVTIGTLSTNPRIQVVYNFGSTADNTKIMELSEIMAVDLTALGLAHLTTAQCDELFAFTASTAEATLANDVGMNNLGGTVGTRFDKVAVVNGSGDSVVYANLVTNGDFSNGTTGWTSASTISVVDGKLNLTGNGNTSSPMAQSTDFSTTMPTGTRVFVKGICKVTSAGCTNIQAETRDGSALGSVTLVSNPVQNTTYNVAGIITTTGITDCVSIRHSYVDASTANGKTMEVDNIMYINLTANTYVQALEAKLGRVLTVDECDLLFSFTSSTNTVVVDTQYALSLDGTDDYGAIANTPSLDVTTNEFALACTFRVANGSSNGSLIAKTSSNFTGAQYGLYYDTSGTIVIVANGVALGTVSGFVATNTWYNLIVYRNKNGEVAVYLNKAVQTPPATNTDPLVSKNNVRLGGVSSNDAGTTHTGYFKGSISTMHIYQAPTLDINKIIARETAIAKDYTGVA